MVDILGNAIPNADTAFDTPDLGEIDFEVNGRRYTTALSYNYEESYLSPSDRWSVSFDQDELSEEDLTALVPRASMSLSINGHPQTTGYIDSIHTSTSNGTIVTISGRDWLSPAVDAHISPRTRFNPSQTLLDVVNTAFEPFGITAIATDNVANANTINGQIYGNQVSKKGKPLKSYGLHELKPYNNESAFAFCSRISQRFGLWIRPSATKGILLVTAPNYDREAPYGLVHKQNGAASLGNNILSSDVTLDAADQPSVIVASGFNGGGSFSYAGMTSAIVNPIISTDYSRTSNEYPNVKFTVGTDPQTTQFNNFDDPYARPLFLYDSESHTIDQLNAFLRRQLSLCLRKAFNAHYVIEGHQIGGVPIAVDTMMSVDDDRSNVHQDLWVLSRKFTKSSNGGTHTSVELILPGALSF